MAFTKTVAIVIAGIFPRTMAHAFVPVAPFLQATLDVVLIGVDQGAWSYDGLDQRFDRHLLHVGQHSKGLDRRHRQTLAWMMLELICSKTVSLGAWVLFVVSRAHYAQSTVRRFSRWLHNHRIKPQPLYGPFIRTE